MISVGNAFSGFAVADAAAARDFYSNTLGLGVREENGMLWIDLGSGASVFAYPKPDHEPATFTVLNLEVADIEAAVDTLTEAGVPFEHYDFEHLKTDAKGIARGHGPTIAWFRDPSGNILSLIEGG